VIAIVLLTLLPAQADPAVKPAPRAEAKVPPELLVQQAFVAAADKAASAVVSVEVAELDLLDEDEPKAKDKPKAKLQPKGKDRKDPKDPNDVAPRESGFLRASDAPTTGVVLTADGWIVTSTFNLGKSPKHIKVKLHDGRELPGTLAGKDLSRGIALIKVPADKLPVPEFADPAAARVGQWTLALGRTFGGKHPSIQYGILSAKERIMGRALQTDAALSPANYGGPLIDIQGRVLGVCVPLSPEGEAVEIGLYDSGIGFAIPAADILRNLDRLKKGEVLYPGFLGILFEEAVGGVQVREVVKETPAAAAGLQKGDLITKVGEVAVDSMFRFRFEVGRRLAGEAVELSVKRGMMEMKVRVVLGRRPG
jgi:serine protease Do